MWTFGFFRTFIFQMKWLFRGRTLQTRVYRNIRTERAELLFLLKQTFRYVEIVWGAPLLRCLSNDTFRFWWILNMFRRHEAFRIHVHFKYLFFKLRFVYRTRTVAQSNKNEIRFNVSLRNIENKDQTNIVLYRYKSYTFSIKNYIINKFSSSTFSDENSRALAGNVSACQSGTIS